MIQNKCVGFPKSDPGLSLGSCCSWVRDVLGTDLRVEPDGAVFQQHRSSPQPLWADAICPTRSPSRPQPLWADVICPTRSPSRPQPLWADAICPTRSPSRPQPLWADAICPTRSPSRPQLLAGTSRMRLKASGLCMDGEVGGWMDRWLDG